MDPIIGPLITGGASLLGSIFSSQTNAQNTQEQIAAQKQMQQETEQFNSEQAFQNRQFQQYNSNTAYQRASIDMQNAGLNPMMMFGSGGPASVPSGSTASVGTPSVPMPTKTSPFANLGEAARVGVATAVSAKEMDKISSQTAQVDLENRAMRRELGYPEVDVGTGAKRFGLPEAKIEATAAGAAVDRQTILTRMFPQKSGEWFASLDESTQKALIAGQKTLDAGGQIIDAGTSLVGKGVGKAAGAAKNVWGYSGKSPEAYTPSLNRLNAASEAAPYKTPWTPPSPETVANRAATVDPGFKPGGIRERAYRAATFDERFPRGRY